MRIDFIGIPVDALTMEQTITKVDEAIQTGRQISHVVINAGKVVAMQKDRGLFDSVVGCDLINADGQSIVWAAKFLGKSLPGRVPGVDLMQELVRLASEKKYKCYFLGAKEEVVRKVVEVFSRKYGKEIIAGCHNGYFEPGDEPGIAKQVAESGAQLLFVAITSPKKEKFLFRYKEQLKKVNFTMGVGGTFDIIAGVTRRAPLWIQKIGMEWFFRLLQEPKRMWKRYLIGNSKFIWLVLKEKIRSKKIK